MICEVHVRAPPDHLTVPHDDGAIPTAICDEAGRERLVGASRSYRVSVRSHDDHGSVQNTLVRMPAISGLFLSSVS